MTYDALIFDIDGTLWNKDCAAAQAWNNACKELGIDRLISVDELKSVTGLPFNECVKALFKELTDQELELYIQTIDRHEKLTLENNSGILYPGVKEGFDLLNTNYEIYLVSNCQVWYMNDFLDASQLGNYISGFSCFQAPHSNKGDNLTHLIAKYDLKNPVYIGDTIWDLEACQQAKCKFIHVTYGHNIIPNYQPAFSAFSELVKFLMS